jgi:glycosyltransferase involved in cell wall biosynthesis
LIAPSARLLDLTRLVSRLGRGALTGIDRVELAYLQQMISRPEPLFGLVLTPLGFVLLDRVGARGILDRVTGLVPVGPSDVLGRMTHRQMPLRARAEADVRRLSIARCLPARLAATLRRVLPRGTVYLNVGHANLTARVVRAVKSVPGAQVLVMVHDTIPLDYPQFCAPGAPQVFSKKLAVVAANADLVVHTARCTMAQTETHFARLGRVPHGVVAPLGVVIAAPDAKGLVTTSPPYFVALGTIEPRKNIGLLVKVWGELLKSAGRVPHLYIVGNRGWADQALYDQLDALVARGAATVLHDLGDEAVTALLQGAEALLFPSLAEGFGLPPLEAAALGVKVIAGKLPVVVEMLDDYPVYVDTTDVYAWLEAISEQMGHRKQDTNAKTQIRVPPNWPDHFSGVFGTA